MIICLLQDSYFSHADVLELIKESFQLWQENGLGSILLRFTPTEFAERAADGSILVAIDESDDTLCGTTTFSLYKNKLGELYAYNKFSAVKSNANQKGIGSRLLECEKRMAKKKGCAYILSNTSALAEWSVKWHKKNGFKIVGLYSTITSDYYSYLFRYQLKSPSIWNSTLFCKFVFRLSYLKTRVMKRSNGSMTSFGTIILKVFKFLS